MSGERLPRCEFDVAELILRLDTVIPGKVDAITPVVDRIMTMARDMGCAEGKEFEIETALRESLANAVIHGCRKDPEKRVEISVGCDKNRGMIIVVRDPGGGFDPKDLPSPVVGENVYSTGGRGIYLINQLMDAVKISRGGTEIWMRKT